MKSFLTDRLQIKILHVFINDAEKWYWVLMNPEEFGIDEMAGNTLHDEWYQAEGDFRNAAGTHGWKNFTITSKF